MKKRKPLFNAKKRVILQALNKSRIGLTPYTIAKRTGVSWVTVKKHVKDLEKTGIIKCPKILNSSRKVCKLNFDLIYGKKPLKKRGK